MKNLFPSTLLLRTIFRSALTHKTQFSFISSNSSFTECVSKDHPYIRLSSSNSQGVTDGVHWWEEETFNNQSKIQFSSTAGNYKFTDCCWEHCNSTSNGGAISLTATGSSLTIMRDAFIDCNTSASYGGGIYVYNCNKLTSQYSLFNKCHAKAKSASLGGAGICIHTSSSADHTIHRCSFIDSDCESDAGGMSIYNVKGTAVKYPIQSSHFLRCRSLTNSADGGAVCYWDNNITLGMQDCLFAHCSAINGGGVFMSLPTPPSRGNIRFCFFTANSATGNGKDVCLHSLQSNYFPLLHCFTTSSGKTVGEFYNSNSHSDWLPKTNTSEKLLSNKAGLPFEFLDYPLLTEAELSFPASNSFFIRWLRKRIVPSHKGYLLLSRHHF